MIRKCDQGCGKVATVYAGDSCAGGWAGFYCEPCQQALRFAVWDRHPDGVKQLCNTLEPQ